jgi:site-specific recombinase XerD
VFNRALKKLDKKLKSHDFRTSKITHMYSAGIDLAEIRDFVSHKNIATTERYLKLDK